MVKWKIISFASVIGNLVGIASASFTLLLMKIKNTNISYFISDDVRMIKNSDELDQES